MIESTVGRSGQGPPIRWGKPSSQPSADCHGRRRSPLGRRFGNASGWFLMLGLLIIGLPMAYQRAIDNGPDLAGFCDAGRYILEHGTREPKSTLSRYWPSADVPWILFALLPISVTAVLWYADRLHGVAGPAANDLRSHAGRSGPRRQTSRHLGRRTPGDALGDRRHVSGQFPRARWSGS